MSLLSPSTRAAGAAAPGKGSGMELLRIAAGALAVSMIFVAVRPRLRRLFRRFFRVKGHDGSRIKLTERQKLHIRSRLQPGPY